MKPPTVVNTKGSRRAPRCVVGFAVVRVGFQLDRFAHGVLEAREGVRVSRFLNVTMRGGQGVDDVEVDGGPVVAVGVVDDSVHYLGRRLGDVVKVDRDVVAGPACAFGSAAKLPGYRIQGIVVRRPEAQGQLL